MKNRHRVLLFTGLLAVCAPAFGQELNPSDTFPSLSEADSLIRAGDAAYDRLDNQAALAAYRQALGPDSSRYALLYRLASAANDRGQDLLADDRRDRAEAFFREAVRYAQAMRQRFPDRSGTWFQLAATTGNLALFKGGKEKVRLGRSVEEYAQRSIALDSTNANAYLALGIFYREVGNLNWVQRTAANVLFGGVPDGGPEKSLRYLEKARERNPDMVMIHYEIAETHLSEDQEAAAVPHLRKAASLPVLNTEERRMQERARERLRARGLR